MSNLLRFNGQLYQRIDENQDKPSDELSCEDLASDIADELHFFEVEFDAISQMFNTAKAVETHLTKAKLLLDHKHDEDATVELTEALAASGMLSHHTKEAVKNLDKAVAGIKQAIAKTSKFKS